VRVTSAGVVALSEALGLDPASLAPPGPAD
ncbi:ArsR family transcriptional regulator, partial [Streptomyces parvus]